MAWEPDEEAYAAALRVAKPGDAPGPQPLTGLTRSYGSAVRLARNTEALAVVLGPGGLWVNSMTGVIMLGDTPLADNAEDVFRDGVEQHYRSGEDGRTPLRLSREDCRRALEHVAGECRMNPLVDELDGLAWDGVRRIDTVLPASLGVPSDGLEALLLRKWMISAVARAYAPGCKVDTVLVLVGPQGALKSSWFRALTGPRWFVDTQIRLDDKDAKLTMRKAWVLEWAELDSMRGKAKEATRAFITSQVDVFRPPYGRSVVEAPRHCVIVGTTNTTEFLVDDEGNRRFWPVAVGAVRLEDVRRERSQLWAEAIVAYRGGEAWHLEKDFEQHLTEAQEKFSVSHDDPWSGLVVGYHQEHNKEFYSASELLDQAIRKPAGQWGRADEMRVAKIASQLGWNRKQTRKSGSRCRYYYPK